MDHTICIDRPLHDQGLLRGLFQEIVQQAN